jgi:hypothetical protein
MANVTIACSIPGGLVLGYTAAPNGSLTVPVGLAGPPYSQINTGRIGAGFTEVDSALWANWLTAYGSSPIITSGAVWEL